MFIVATLNSIEIRNGKKMKLSSAIMMSAICSTVLSGCLNTEPAPRRNSEPAQQFSQTINFKRMAGGTGMIEQTLKPGAGSPQNSRICFINNGPIPAALAHDAPGINPLSAAPGGRSCANFKPASRVSFTLAETAGPFPQVAAPERDFVYSMAPFEGGVLSLVWTTQ